jgi:hypothetical protein
MDESTERMSCSGYGCSSGPDARRIITEAERQGFPKIAMSVLHIDLKVVLVSLKRIHITCAMRDCRWKLQVLAALLPNAELCGKVHRERQAGDPN